MEKKEDLLLHFDGRKPNIYVLILLNIGKTDESIFGLDFFLL